MVTSADQQPPVAPNRVPLYKRLRGRPLATWKTFRNWSPWLFLAALLLALGWLFVKPAPPSRVIIATGPNDGSYQWFAKHYVKTFAENGVTLELKASAGSVENYRLLDASDKKQTIGSPDDGVTVAMVQSGTCPEGINVDLRSAASLYLEPVWIFYRSDQPLQLADLRGKRVAVGPDGGGARSIAERLLKANQIASAPDDQMPPNAQASASTQPAQTQPVEQAASRPTSRPAPQPVYLNNLAGRAAADALHAGKVDAAILVFSPRHPMIADLLRDPSLRLMSFERHEAYARIFPFLSDVKLPRGTIDLAQDLPHEDVYILAPAANLVCRADLHPAIVALLLKAAVAAHERGDLLSPPGKLPSTQYVEFPVDPAAAEYFRAGPPFLQRILPFWVAAFVDRMKIFLLPLLTLLIPLGRIAPPLYVWRIRSRIYRWYRVLREIDLKLRADRELQPAGGETLDPNRFRSEITTLAEMESELAEQKVPLSYMQEFYNLRLHTDFLRRRLHGRLSGRRQDDALEPPTVDEASE